MQIRLQYYVSSAVCRWYCKLIAFVIIVLLYKCLSQDFSYERKQFADAAAEQEKDVRLYELVCQSVLSEKDLKRVSY